MPFMRNIRIAPLACVLSAVSIACGSCAPPAARGPADWGEERAAVDRRIERSIDGRDFAGALRLADSLAAAGAVDTRATIQRARALAGLGRSAEATAAFETAILADYEDCYAHLEFAGFLMRTEKTGRAHTEYMEAKNFCEEARYPLIYRNLAVASIKLSRPAQALGYVSEGLLADPGDPYLLGLKGMLIARERPVEAESLFVAALASKELSTDFLVQYGLLMLNDRRPAEAARVFERAASLAPADRDIRGYLAEAYDRSGRPVDAERLLRDLLAAEDDPALRQRLARVLFHAQRYAEALDIYRGLDETPEIMDRIAMCLHELGKDDEALPWARRAAAGKPDWPQGLVNLAVILGAMGELDEAEALLERAIAIEPDNVAARTNLERLREARRASPGDGRRQGDGERPK